MYPSELIEYAFEVVTLFYGRHDIFRSKEGLKCSARYPEQKETNAVQLDQLMAWSTALISEIA